MDVLVTTRIELHRIAREVLAAELAGCPEPLTLRRTPGGFGTPERVVDGAWRSMRVDGPNLVHRTGEHESWQPIHGVDAASARRLALFFEVADDALDAFRRNHLDLDPTIVQLFPHHFDLAISLAEVNVGASPGDADHDVPYFYVGPWLVQPHPMWNEPWGCSLPWTPSTYAIDACRFFEEGFAAAREGAGRG
jgi:hypothetical protein